MALGIGIVIGTDRDGQGRIGTDRDENDKDEMRVATTRLVLASHLDKKTVGEKGE